MNKMSLPWASASFSASKASPAASEPVGRAITGAPMRSPQICSCSIAAARNVSPAASITLKPSRTAIAPSLPMVVVLPEPFTPTTSTTWGARCRTAAESPPVSGPWRPRRQHAADLVGRDLLLEPPLPDGHGDPRGQVGTPRSAWISTSSSSSSIAWSSLRWVKSSVRLVPSWRDDLVSPLDSRSNQPRRAAAAALAAHRLGCRRFRGNGLRWFRAQPAGCLGRKLRRRLAAIRGSRMRTAGGRTRPGRCRRRSCLKLGSAAAGDDTVNDATGGQRKVGEPHRHGVLGAPEARALDQHGAAAPDLGGKKAVQCRLAGGPQPCRSAPGSRVAAPAASAPPACPAGPNRERHGGSHPHSATSSGNSRNVAALGRKAGDEIGAEGTISGRSCAELSRRTRSHRHGGAAASSV